jgi:hypothetical protein
MIDIGPEYDITTAVQRNTVRAYFSHRLSLFFVEKTGKVTILKRNSLPIECGWCRGTGAKVVKARRYIKGGQESRIVEFDCIVNRLV